MNAADEKAHTGRLCSSCGTENIAIARFCGNCGVRLCEEQDSRPSRPRRHVVFRGILVLALFILVASVVMSYQLFNSTASIKVSTMPFADVPVDHPVYRMCRNLVEIQAIGYRKIMEFAPYASISAAEWNFALQTAARHQKRTVPEAALFSRGDTVDAASLTDKLRILGFDPGEIPDASRIRGFYLLEKAMFVERQAQ